MRQGDIELHNGRGRIYEPRGHVLCDMMIFASVFETLRGATLIQAKESIHMPAGGHALEQVRSELTINSFPDPHCMIIWHFDFNA